jgi:hypothetical protein
MQKYVFVIFKQSIEVCIFIRYLESITQALNAYFGLDKREGQCLQYLFLF